MEGRTVATGRDILRLFGAAAGWLESRAGMLDSINVFPVPDGDTGANMLRTLQAALAAAGWPSDSAPTDADSPRASTVSAALARGAFEGARGNSGVILSQLFRGLSTALDGRETCAADDLRAGFQKAHAFARAGLAQPIEGTILTVLGDVARALESLRPPESLSFSAALETAVDAAKESVTRSPFLLAVLRESGVVDAGAQGLFFILEGALRSLRAESPVTEARAWSAPPVPEDSVADRPTAGWLSGGYCTGLIIEGKGLSSDEIRAALGKMGTSLIVAGNGDAVRIHIHTADPDSVLAYARSVGTLSRIEVEVLPETGGKPGAQAVALAIVPDEGFVEVFRGLGAATLVGRSPGAPSADEILSAARKLAAPHIILVPIDEAGRRAAELAQRAADGRELIVVSAKTIPQGIAAAVALRPEAGSAENVSSMRLAMGAVRTLEVSWEPGDDEAVEALISGTDLSGAEIVTLYVGAGVAPEMVERIRGALLARQPLLSIERVDTGQARPRIIIGVE